MLFRSCVHLGPVPTEVADAYAVLHEAHAAGVRAGVVGNACQDVDRAARAVITAAGYGEYFIHRTGHGIGLETHEDPYLVSGNQTMMKQGFAFSIEPGFYREGLAGARIEDIVVCGTDGAIVLNNRPRELSVIH